ncbi:hypothetical protein Goklo_023131 [Gossypium klotzschianum]|uniref:DUF4283 domain-containing protein n=1 Tax=Gossypium klotzschianum TaxID=34286 RepID=A0A7J8TPZ4_9ROSI|nr:hypothetical protein [Gossypium klotzschianum]
MRETFANLWHPLGGVTIAENRGGSYASSFVRCGFLGLDSRSIGCLKAIRAYKGFLSCQYCAWEKELPFEWDLSIKALPRRAVVAKSCWLHEERDVPWVVKMRSFSIQIRGRPLLNIIVFKSLRYRLALRGKVDGCNKNPKLKCPKVREPPSYSSPSTRAEGDQPAVAFCIEKKVQSIKIEKVQKSWGFVNGIDVSSNGTRGGLSLCWKHGCIISLHIFLRNHIDVMVEDDSDGNTWGFVGYYGHLEENRWYQS